ncbi:autotransporter outer membrane beta-barrel domain-containing protein [Burkholderia ambifaria]|uniref:autotransporter outer membrane beta-barrel domain-containing protein n=1 Tax=Burkholderia ambifaria TaxID=152480 RepID=UPI001589AF35|nr:autotransporter outer membrane beta-barrel domain-containing protein [Burkholderia ambifaria]WDS02126.1 autotransporter outer membrane beta-barrel domain-containing protein [Burkholderia ambifaria]
MNHSFRSIWSEAAGCWVAVAETARARGKRSGSESGASRRAGRMAARRSPLRVAALGVALAALSAGSAYASTCGDGSAVTGGGTCALGSYSPTVNDNLAGATTVSGGDTVGVTGAWTSAAGDPGYSLTPIGNTSIVSGNPNQPLLSLGGKTQSVSTPDSITGTHTSIATYDSSAFAASTAGTTNVPVYQDVNGNQYVNLRLGTVDSTGGTLNVSIGNPANAPDAAGNAISIAPKQTDLTFADGTGSAKSVVSWNSRNQIWLGTGDYLASGGAVGQVQLDVPTYAGTFTAFDGSTWTVSDAASLAAYNDFLARAVRSGALGTQAAYDTAFGQAVTFTQETFQYANNVSSGDKNTLPIDHLSVMHGTGASATLQIGKDGQIDFRGTNTIESSSAVLAENGAHFVNDGRLSGDFTLVRLLSGASGVNNGVISAGYASGDNVDTSSSTPPDNFGFHAYTEGNGVYASGTGTTFVNNGVMNVGAWTLDGNRPDLQNYGVAVTGGATASNAGTINVGVNATTLDSQAIGGFAAGGTFTNEAGGTIQLGRAAQYAPGAAANDVALSARAYGILLGASGTASNLGSIVIGSQTQNGAGMASVGSSSGTLHNAGSIVVNGAASGTPLANVGMLAANTAATVTNTGTITLNGVNGIGIMVVGTSTATAATSTGTINVAGGLDPASDTRNYGVWADGSRAQATVDGALNLTGNGAIGVHARSGATIDVGANAVPRFMSGTNQIGFYAYGAGSRINVAAQHLSVDTDDSTLFRIAGGAAYTGASAAGTLTTDVTGQRARGVLATGAGTTLSTGNATYNVNGANGIAVAVEGGAQGSIDAGATINLHAAGAMAGVVDGQAHDLAGANAGAPVATTLANAAAVTSSSAGVTGFVARNLGTLENRGSVLLTGAGSTGVVIGPLGTVNNASAIRVSNGTGALVQGASATLANAGTIEADDGVAGVHLTGAGASVALSGAGTVIANGSADGVRVDASVADGGIAAGATSIAVGGAGKGIDNLGTNTTIALSGTQIGTTGNGADGLSSTGAGARIATDAATVVRTAGDTARGLVVAGADSTLAANGTTVATTGAGAHAIVAGSGASAWLSGAKVSTAGAAAEGLVAQNGGRIGDTGSSIASAAGNGANVDGGGVLALTGTTLKGATAGVLSTDTLASGATSTVLVDGGSIASVAGPAFAARGGTVDIAVRNGTVVTAGNGTLLDLANGSTATFNASAVSLTGDIVSDASSTGNVLLANDTTLTGKIDPVALTVDGSSAWHMTGSSVLSSLNNAGLVAFAAPSGAPTAAGSYRTLTTGSYVGYGGTIALNTYLGADASPTDRLIVNGGTASGTTGLKIANTAGTGAQTTGDGIPVVVTANGGTTAASAFHLAGPVQAGAYEYRLYRGGQSDANGWYLRSQLDPTDPDDSIHPSGNGNGNGNANGNGNGSNLAYRPGVAGYAMTPLLNADYGFSTLGKLHERVGDIYNLEKQAPGNRDGVWGRIGGQSLDANAGRFAADERTFFAQFGKDWTLEQAAAGGSTHAGVTASIGIANASFDDIARADTPGLSTSTGSVEMHAQSVGGYWTRYLADGTYFDSVGQVTHYGNRYRDSYGNDASQNGFGIALSQEVGKPFGIGGTPIAVEPQAQLMYQYLKLNGFNDNVSAVSGTTTNALRGRVGVRIFRPNLDANAGGGAATPYFTADVLHDFLSPGQTVVGGTPFATHLGRTWYELGLGVTAGFGKSGELYANVKYARNLGGDYRRGITGQVGYRYSW